MKTLDPTTVAADSVISEVRRAKTAVAQRYGFDVIAMVRALRAIDETVATTAPPPPPVLSQSHKDPRDNSPKS